MMVEAKSTRWLQSPHLSWVLFALAAGVRLVYVGMGYEVAPQDTADYDEIALNLLSGEGFVARANWFGYELHSWRPPLYPFFLAGIYWVFGYSHLAVRLVQVLLGAATVVLVYRLGRRAHPPSAPIAGAIAAVYTPLVASANEVMSETLFTFLLVLAVYLLTGVLGRAGADPRRWPAALAAGATIGLAALTRPAALILWPVQVAVWIRRGWTSRRESPTVWWRCALWISAGTLLVLAPWTARNWSVHGALVVISSQSGFIVARSNAPSPDWKKGAEGWRIDRGVFERTPSEVERDRNWLRQGLSFPLHHPGSYLRLVGERFLRFVYFLTPAYNFWFATVFPLAVLGMWRCRSAEAHVLMTALTLTSTAVFCAVLYGSSRFRLPMEPFLILFAAAFVHHCRQQWGAHRTAVATGALVAFNGLAWWQSEAMRSLVLGILSASGLK